MTTVRGRRMVRWSALTAGLCLLLSPVTAAASGPLAGADRVKPSPNPLAKVDQAVVDQVTRHGSAGFWVYLDAEADLSAAAKATTRVARTTRVYQDKVRHAEKSQSGLRKLLTERGTTFRPYWIVNAIHVEHAGMPLLTEIAGRVEVKQVLADRTYELPKLPPGAEQAKVAALEWNIDRIGAGRVWSEFGVTGQDIVVASIDSGVRYSHEALVGAYRGNNGDGTFDHDYDWFDPANVCGTPSLVPCDNTGHGTHTMGTMVGDDGAGNQIGVAPGARWIAAKGCESNTCTIDSLIAAGQWVLAPTDLTGQNPRPELAPHVVNNSWGGGPNNFFYQPIVQAWVAAGIFPAFAVGNFGSSCDTAVSPGDYAEGYAVGAFNIGNRIANFSSRGPGIGADIKPDVAAPGEDIRSAHIDGGYIALNGTSMATPHLAGAVALLWSAAPHLIGDIAATREALDNGAVDVDDQQCGGDADDNNVWGEGRLDALAAVERSAGAVGALTGTATTAATPLAGVEVTVSRGAFAAVRHTDASGAFGLPRLAVGDYTVSGRKFGYRTDQRQVTITEGQTATVALDLPLLATYTVSGTVRGNGAPLAGATVSVPGTPIAAVTSGADGRYTLSGVPAGEYDVRADYGRWLAPQTQHLTVDDDETLDFALAPKSDTFGYTMSAVTPGYVSAGTVLPLRGNSSLRVVTLPFPVTFYGTTYRTVEVHTDGHLSFTAARAAENGSIPRPEQPNAAVYPFWDDLVVDAQASVRTQTLGTAPDRRHVVEWRDVTFAAAAGKRVSFEVVFHENGRILFQYRGIDAADAVEAGNSATVGLENEIGSVALQYSFDQPHLADESAILFTLPGNGLVRGTVTDANDNQPLAGATVTVQRGGGAAPQALTTDAKGFYQALVAVGSFTVIAGADAYQIGRANLVIGADGTVLTRNFALRTARVEAAPEALEIVVPAGETRTRELTLRNSGSATGSWQVKEAPGGSATPTASLAQGAGPERGGTRGLRPTGATAQVAPMAPGEIIKSWQIPGDVLAGPWGIADTGADTGGVWISDFNPADPENAEFTTDGALTSRRPWTFGGVPGDMAWLPDRGQLCQLDLLAGFEDVIRCWEPDTGELTATIRSPFGQFVPRGLAHRADDDTFYVGTMSGGLLYHVKGLSHPDPGALIGYCLVEDLPVITGLGYSNDFGVLWLTSIGPSDPIVAINPDTCAKVRTVADPDPLREAGGLELDAAGNLWTVAMSRLPGSELGSAYLVDSGMPSFQDVPWLSTGPAQGTLTAGTTQRVDVRVDATGLSPGVHAATIYVASDSAKKPLIGVPVKVVVPAYRTGMDTGSADPVVDGLGDTWLPDQPYSSGNHGYLGSSSTPLHTTEPIDGASNQDLLRTSREGAAEYRFDNLPPGVYEVELKFAELAWIDPGERLFDVVLERQLVLPGLDVVGEVGSFAAFEQSFLVEVNDGTLNARFLIRAGKPIINAIRVTERPDKTVNESTAP